MLMVLTVLVMLVVAYCFWREGLLTACTTCINVLIAGLVAFNFWEPIADLLDPLFQETILAGYEDALCLVGLFALTLGLLRWATNSLAGRQLEYHPVLDQGGRVAVGLLTGYLIAGFLVCVLQTLPLPDDFAQFDPGFDPNEAPGVRHFLPPDHVWLAMMRHAGSYSFPFFEDEEFEKQNGREPDTLAERYITFDKYATFELRYLRYRRYNGSPDSPMKYRGELDREVHEPRQ
jgi:hypothetical protein